MQEQKRQDARALITVAVVDSKGQCNNGIRQPINPTEKFTRYCACPLLIFANGLKSLNNVRSTPKLYIKIVQFEHI